MKTIITPIKGDHEAYAFRQNGFQGVIYIEKDSRAIIWPGKYDAKEFVTRVDQTVVPYREAQRFVIQIPDHEGFDFYTQRQLKRHRAYLDFMSEAEKIIFLRVDAENITTTWSHTYQGPHGSSTSPREHVVRVDKSGLPRVKNFLSGSIPRIWRLMQTSCLEK